MEQNEEDESRAKLLPNLRHSVNELAEVTDVHDENNWKNPKCPPDCHEMNFECENLFNHIEGDCGCKSPYILCGDYRECPKRKRYLELVRVQDE